MSKYAPDAHGLLAPIQSWLDDTRVSEILVNRPGEIWVEKGGHIGQHRVPELSERHLQALCQLIANENQQVLSQQYPLLSASLKDGSRIQICIPPTAKYITMSIRRQVVRQMTLQDYAQCNFYREAHAQCASTIAIDQLPETEKALLALYDQAQWDTFLQRAIELKKNIVISGGTSSGKTTFLNACLHAIPHDQRVIILEDTREIESSHPNQVQLLASKGQQAESNVTMQDLVQCCLRLRPDRIIMGEIRGAEIMDFISACSTGHEGSLTTIHANNPRVAMLHMMQMYKLNNVPSMTDNDIQRELNEVVDVIVQLNKTPHGRVMQGVYYKYCELSKSYKNAATTKQAI